MVNKIIISDIDMQHALRTSGNWCAMPIEEDDVASLVTFDSREEADKFAAAQIETGCHCRSYPLFSAVRGHVAVKLAVGQN